MKSLLTHKTGLTESEARAIVDRGRGWDVPEGHVFLGMVCNKKPDGYMVTQITHWAGGRTRDP